MAILPLQGIAAAFAPVHRVMNTQAATMPCHDHAGSAHHAPDGGMQDKNSPQETDTSHFCCHQVFTCVSRGAAAVGARKFNGVSDSVRTLITLYIPDSPDRPPRG